MNRDELVERVALQAANRRRAVYGLVPLLDMSSVKEPSLSMLIDDARAALAIIEPAVRADAAEIAALGCELSASRFDAIAQNAAERVLATTLRMQAAAIRAGAKT